MIQNSISLEDIINEYDICLPSNLWSDGGITDIETAVFREELINFVKNNIKTEEQKIVLRLLQGEKQRVSQNSVDKLKKFLCGGKRPATHRFEEKQAVSSEENWQKLKTKLEEDGEGCLAEKIYFLAYNHIDDIIMGYNNFIENVRTIRHNFKDDKDGAENKILKNIAYLQYKSYANGIRPNNNQLFEYHCKACGIWHYRTYHLDLVPSCPLCGAEFPQNLKTTCKK